MTVADLTPVQLLAIIVAGGFMVMIAEKAIFYEKYRSNGERVMAAAGLFALLGAPILLALSVL